MNCVMILGNPSQYTGLVHAAVPEHAVVAGGSFGACGGGDALPTRPVQVGTTATTSTTHTPATWPSSPGNRGYQPRPLETAGSQDEQ